jgi:DNA-binding HxlR family transcriptional regulator
LTTVDSASRANAIGRALGVLGDEWTLLIIRYALAGARRYSDWRRELGIADAVLTARLSTLTTAGLLRTEPAPDRRDRTQYQLTDAGRDVWRVLVGIWAWEMDWVEGQADVLPRMRHGSCGAPCRPVLVCASCGGATGADEVAVSGGDPEAMAGAVPIGSTRRRVRRGVRAGPGLFPETMALVGNRWSSALLGAAFLGAARFGEFQALLGAPPATVADRLRTFTALGVLDAKADGGYGLTAKGEAFFPVVAHLIAWGERWLGERDAPVLDARHRACGRPFAPEFTCSACGGRLERRSVLVEPVA